MRKTLSDLAYKKEAVCPSVSPVDFLEIPACNLGDEWGKMKSAYPYSVGDVIWVDVGEGRPKLAKIHHFTIDTSPHGHCMYKTTVQIKNKSGLWSKRLHEVWNANIINGYKLASA